MGPREWDEFEGCCDHSLAEWVANLEQTTREDKGRVLTNTLWRDWLSAFQGAAMQVVGQKRVCANSRSWMTDEVRELYNQRVAAGREVRECEPQRKQEAQARLDALRKKVRATIARAKAAEKLRKCSQLERDSGQAKRFWG